MCGRYSITTPLEALRRLFRFDGLPNLAPRYNVAPTQEAPVVRRKAEGEGRELAMLRWGLVPNWAKDRKSAAKMINARAETAAEKPAFRSAFVKRRCLVLADGFYEWQAVAGAKQPWRVVLADGAPFAMAGLWEHWRGPDGQVLESFAILTTNANDRLAALHARMPAILPADAIGVWLDQNRPAAEIAALLRPYPSDKMTAYAVSQRVNAVLNDDAGCIAPLVTSN